jgi:3-keto-disaccharide hydrolase
MKTIAIICGLLAAQQGSRMPEPLVADDHAGFESIFDGKTLSGWDGDPACWRVEDGAIVGDTHNPIKVNTFLIWRGGEPRDFELKVQYRISAVNSGVQYRSVELPEAGKWAMKGYQADIDFDNRYTGQLYEERGRGFLALRGQVTRLESGKNPKIVAALAPSDELKKFIDPAGWNQYHIIARGNVLIHILNGHLMSQAIDEDATARAMGGKIGLQLHVGPPMKAEFRNIWLKKL